MTNVERETSRAMALDAAHNITRLAAELHYNHMDEALPVTALTLLCPAIFMHLVNMKSQNASTKDTAMLSFRVCMRLLERLKVLYW